MPKINLTPLLNAIDAFVDRFPTNPFSQVVRDFESESPLSLFDVRLAAEESGLPLAFFKVNLPEVAQAVEDVG